MKPKEQVRQLMERLRRQRGLVVVLALAVVFAAGVMAQAMLPGDGTTSISQRLDRSVDDGGSRAGHEAPLDMDSLDRAGPAPGDESQLGRVWQASAARMVIWRGEATVEVNDVAAAFDEVVAAVEALGGFVASSRLGDRPAPIIPRQPDPAVESPSSGRLTVRIPAAELNIFLKDVCDLGRRCVPATDSDDITEQYVDTQARLGNYQAQEARMLQLLDQAQDVDEVLKVEREIWRVREEIERLEARIRHWDDAVDLATVRVTLAAREGLAPAQGEFAQRLSAAFRESINLFVRGIETMIIGVGVLAPWVLLVASGWFGYGHLRRRRLANPETVEAEAGDA